MRILKFAAYLALPLGLVSAGVVQAITIDTLGVPALGQNVETTVTPGNPDNQTFQNAVAFSPAEVIGGYREMSIDSIFLGVSGGGEGEALVNKFTSGSLVVNNDTNVQSTVEILWDANGAGLNVDLLEGTGDPTAYAFILDVLSIDANGVGITVTLSDGTNTVAGTDTFFSPGSLSLAYSDFAGDAGFDFTDVFSIKMTMVGEEPAWDGEVVLVKSDPISTPIPGTLALLGLGLAGLGVRRAKRS